MAMRSPTRISLPSITSGLAATRISIQIGG
jgi:hypothetical protein